MQYIVPVIFLLIGMLVMRYTSFSQVQPSRALNIQNLYNTVAGNTNFMPTPYSAATQFCANPQTFDYRVFGIPQQPPNVATINPYPNTDDSNPLLGPCVAVSTTNGFTAAYLMGKASADGTASAATAFPLIPLPTAQSVGDMSRALRNPATKYRASVVGALSFTSIAGDAPSGQVIDVEYLVHGNFTAVYAGPLYAQFVADSVLKTITPKASVRANINPLPLTSIQNTVVSNYQVNIVVTFILLAIPYVPAAFATFIVREREVKAKHQQLVSGVSIPAYWLAAFIWDNASYQVRDPWRPLLLTRGTSSPLTPRLCLCLSLCLFRPSPSLSVARRPATAS